MTYQELKTKVVDTNNTMTKKEFNKMLLSFSLFVVLLTLCLLVLVSVVLPLQFILLVVILAIALYTATINSFPIEDSNTINIVQKLNKFWWSPLILLIVEVFILTYLGFM